MNRNLATRNQNLINDFNRLFGNEIPDFFVGNDATYPPYTAYFRGTDLNIDIAVSGFEKEEIKVSFDGKTLEVTGERANQVVEEGIRYVHRGLAQRDFVRKFDIRGNFKLESAKLKNGILSVALKDTTEKFIVEVSVD